MRTSQAQEKSCAGTISAFCSSNNLDNPTRRNKMGACGVKIEEEYLIFYFLVDTVYRRERNFLWGTSPVVSQKKTIISIVFIKNKGKCVLADGSCILPLRFQVHPLLFGQRV